MNLLFLSIAWIIFFVLLMVISRQLTQYSLLGIEQEQDKLLKEAQRLNNLKKEKQTKLLASDHEFTQIFTLYEMTEKISHHLNIAKAFELFKETLAAFIQFEECELIEDKNSKEIGSDKVFYELEVSKGNNGWIVLDKFDPVKKEIVDIIVGQFSLIYRRLKYQKAIEHVAITDGLTTLFNRRYFMERLTEEIVRAEQQQNTLGLLMLDIDFFKRINDDHGHLSGDFVLSEVGKVIKESIREIDIPGRFGGEEFMVILPETNKEGAEFVAERIRKTLAEHVINVYDKQLQVTVSIGVVMYPQASQVITELIEFVDKALYQAKKEGRNKVVTFTI